MLPDTDPLHRLTAPERPATLDLAAIRARHTALLLRRLWDGDRARVDLAQELGLSRSAVSSIVSELMAVGLVQELGTRSGSRSGRRATMLTLNVRAAALLAVDLGASHARVDLLDLRCRTLATRTVPHDILSGPAATYGLLARLCGLVLAEAGVAAGEVALVGVGVPGPVDYATGRVVQPPNMPGWDGENVGEALREALGYGVLVDNDANLGALAEARFGAHRGASDLIYVKAATGIGAGILLGGRLHRGVRGGAGEIGHISINERGPVGRSGNPGSLESYAAAQVLLALAAELREGRPSALPAVPTLADLTRLSSSDAVARDVWQAAGHHVGVAISTVLNLFNPSAVVIGGRLALAGEVFLEAVRDTALARTLRINAGGVRLSLTTLGENVGVLGAGAMLLGHLLTPAGLPHLYAVSARRAAQPQCAGAGAPAPVLAASVALGSAPASAARSTGPPSAGALAGPAPPTAPPSPS